MQINYTVVSGSFESIGDMVNAVSRYGRRPIGGVAPVLLGKEVVFYQAMIKEVPEQPTDSKPSQG